MLFVGSDVQYVARHNRVANLLVKVISLVMSTYSWVVCNGHFVVFSNVTVYTADVIVNESSRQVCWMCKHSLEEASLTKVTQHQPWICQLNMSHSFDMKAECLFLFLVVWTMVTSLHMIKNVQEKKKTHLHICKVQPLVVTMSGRLCSIYICDNFYVAVD